MRIEHARIVVGSLFTIAGLAYLIVSVTLFTTNLLWTGIAVLLGAVCGGIGYVFGREPEQEAGASHTDRVVDEGPDNSLFWVAVITATLTVGTRLFLTQAQINYLIEGIAMMIAVAFGRMTLRHIFKA